MCQLSQTGLCNTAKNACIDNISLHFGHLFRAILMCAVLFQYGEARKHKHMRYRIGNDYTHWPGKKRPDVGCFCRRIVINPAFNRPTFQIFLETKSSQNEIRLKMPIFWLTLPTGKMHNFRSRPPMLTAKKGNAHDVQFQTVHSIGSDSRTACRM